MSISHCQKIKHDSKVKVEELGRKAVFLNSAKTKFIITRFDGCVLINKIAADFIVTKCDVGHIAVELKGKDVDHAAKQVFATAQYWKDAKTDLTIGAALIVCNEYPRITTKIQKLKAAFAKQFKAPLHVVSRNLEYEFEKVLSFTGPY